MINWSSSISADETQAAPGACAYIVSLLTGVAAGVAAVNNSYHKSAPISATVSNHQFRAASFSCFDIQVLFGPRFTVPGVMESWHLEACKRLQANSSHRVVYVLAS